MHRLRVLKSPSEAQLMRATCRIGGEAIVSAMGWTHAGCSEHQLFACVDYQSRMHGAERLAYPPVVASGPRSTIIHYIDDNQLIADGDLVLMDAGGCSNFILLIIIDFYTMCGQTKISQEYIEN